MEPTKLFISHASEDKQSFVEPLVHALEAAGFKVWYDRFELTLGDSLLEKISQGLRECDFGVVVLSPEFFRKKWTKAELDGLFALESTEKKVILPIWHAVDVADVTAFSPILAGRLGAPTSGGVESVVSEIQRAVQAAERQASFSTVESALSRFRALDSQVGGTKRAVALAGSPEGIRLAEEAAAALMTSLRDSFEPLAAASNHLAVTLDKEMRLQFGLSGPYRLRFNVTYHDSVTNALSLATLCSWVFQRNDPWGSGDKKVRTFVREDFNPTFHHSGKLVWRSGSSSKEYTTEQLSARFVDDTVAAVEALHSQAQRRK